MAIISRLLKRWQPVVAAIFALTSACTGTPNEADRGPEIAHTLPRPEYVQITLGDDARRALADRQSLLGVLEALQDPRGYRLGRHSLLAARSLPSDDGEEVGYEKARTIVGTLSRPDDDDGQSMLIELDLGEGGMTVTGEIGRGGETGALEIARPGRAVEIVAW